MKYVLAEIENGKICGIYGGQNYKYADIVNFICSSNIHGCSYKIESLEEAIQIRNRLIGTCTDICVVTNALLLKTHFPEKIITVKAELCAGTTPENHRMALEVMKSCQIEVE